MAGSYNNTVDKAVELEVMSKEDSSWHPCLVSLCPSGAGVVVYYGNNDLEDTFVSEEEIVARLRVRSNPLQGDDCIHVEQGEHVLAAQKSKGPFFDAEVEEVLRVRHSKKVHCRCTFLIKWLHQDPKGGTLVVPSSSIMKLATESIISHPTISAFFNAVRTMSPLPTVGNYMDSELDLHQLIGKQIEEISHSADASKKSIREDMALGFEVHTKGKIQHRPVAASIASKSQVQATPDLNHLRRSTRRSNKLQTETEVKDPPPTVPSIQKELPQNKSPVNPLAARAALASLMSKVPKNLEFSFYQKGEKCFTNSLDFTNHKQVNLETLNVTEYISSSVMNNFSLTGTFSSETEVASFVPKPDNIVKSLFSTRSAAEKPQDLDVPSTIWTKDCEEGKKNPGVTNISANYTRSIAEKNVSQCREATRVTRTAVQKVADTSIDIIESKLMSATNSRRFTRSAVHKEEEIKTKKTEQAVKENRSKSDETDIPDLNVMAQESYALKEKHEVAVGSLDTERDSISTKAPRSLMTIEQRSKKNDIESTIRVLEIKTLGNTRRLTRSAVHKDIANTTMKNLQGLVENKCPENTDSSGGNVSPLGTALSLNAEISLPPTEERNNKMKMSAAFKTTQETEGHFFNDGGNSQSHKRKSTSSQTHEVRSSPRLKFLPRTRSQSKN